MMTYKKMDEIYNMSFINFVHILLLVLRHLSFGLGPCTFEILEYRLFLESVCVGKQELGLVSDPSSKGHEIPHSSSIYIALRATFRLWVLFRLKFAIAATSRTSFVFNDQTKASQNPTLINKAFILYSQYPDCNISFLLVLRLLAGNRPLWSG